MIERSAGLTVAWGAVSLLLTIVLVFAVIRLLVDVPNITSGTLPEPDSFEYRYARYPWLAYLHIAPGVLYLLLAPLQLARGFRRRHIRLHRRAGRIAIVAGLIAGLAGGLFGLLFPFEGALESAASVVFGTWFVAALIAAYRAIRANDIARHRRWMIRAFAIGVAVATIRLWIAAFEGSGLLTFRGSFGVAFWLAFLMHALAAELWLRVRSSPVPSEAAGSRVKPSAGAT